MIPQAKDTDCMELYRGTGTGTGTSRPLKRQRKSRAAQPFDYAALQQDSITSVWVRAFSGVPFLHFQFHAFPLKGDLKIRSGD